MLLVGETPGQTPTLSLWREILMASEVVFRGMRFILNVYVQQITSNAVCMHTVRKICEMGGKYGYNNDMLSGGVLARKGK